MLRMSLAKLGEQWGPVILSSFSMRMALPGEGLLFQPEPQKAVKGSSCSSADNTLDGSLQGGSS